jgi:hypothetical protein
MKLWLGGLAAIALVGCGLLLEDLSNGGEGGDGDSDGGGAPGDGSVREQDQDVPPIPAEAGLPDAPIVDDLDGGPDAADADAGWRFELDCTGTVICDGFEGRTDLLAAPVGRWNDSHTDAGGTTSFSSQSPAAGLRSINFVSPANPTDVSKLLFLGANDLDFASETPTIDLDFDMHIYRYEPFPAGTVRSLIGVMLYSNNADTHKEYAGIRISAEKGLHAEIREYASPTATQRTADRYTTIPINKLTGWWHHVHLEAIFSKTGTGKLEVSIDGENVASIRNLITRTNQSVSKKFVVWVGATAPPGAPAISVRYDNVELRVR